MLIRGAKTDTVFYSYLACFVKQSTGHTHTGHTDRENTPNTGTHTRTTRPQTNTSHKHEYITLEQMYMHVIYRVGNTEYAIRILVVAPPENVNTYSTHRLVAP